MHSTIGSVRTLFAGIALATLEVIHNLLRVIVFGQPHDRYGVGFTFSINHNMQIGLLSVISNQLKVIIFLSLSVMLDSSNLGTCNREELSA